MRDDVYHSPFAEKMRELDAKIHLLLRQMSDKKQRTQLEGKGGGGAHYHVILFFKNVNITSSKVYNYPIIADLSGAMFYVIERKKIQRDIFSTPPPSTKLARCAPLKSSFFSYPFLPY